MTDPGAVVRRDRFGRPYIKQAVNPGKELAYTRVTTVAEVLDDRFNLELWKQRQVATGLAMRPDLVALAASHPGDKAALDRVCSDAMDAAASSAVANLGTSVHAFVHQINQGQEASNVPATLIGDLAAYTVAMQPWEVLRSETMVVLDPLLVAGTFDILVRHRKTGQVRIADVKTGSGAVTYGQQAIAVQLALYSRGEIYHHDTGDREILSCDQEQGLVIHLPVGRGACTLFDVDLSAGWEAAQRALWVRDWRKRRDLFQPHAFAARPELTDLERINSCGSADSLLQLWRELAGDGRDMSGLLGEFGRRKRELLANL